MVFGLIQLLNQLHRQVTKTIMVKLEFLLGISQIDIARVINGRDMAMATSLLVPKNQNDQAQRESMVGENENPCERLLLQ